MISQQIALVSESPDLAIGELARVSAAVQKQILNDLARLWGVHGSVDVFASIHDVPAGYWPIIIRDDIDSNEAGFHKHDENNQPFALVAFTGGWELAVSHEALEMLVDPAGNRLIAGQSIMPGQGQVMYLQEICDPCAGIALSYQIDGVPVCDFCTPHYFDSVMIPGVLYDCRGKISQPLEVLKGGYLSWQVPQTGEWWQQDFFGDSKEFASRGQVTLAPHQSLRAAIDRQPPELDARKRRSQEAGAEYLESAHAERERVTKANHARAERWRRRIDDVVSKSLRPTRNDKAPGFQGP